jgi:hypothetical protein
VIRLISIPNSRTSAPPDPQVQGHGLVGEAPVKLVDMVALSEQPRRFLARGKRHRQIAGQAATAYPLEEVTHSPSGGGAVSEPLIQVRLRQVAQDLAALVQPGQQVEGGQDAGPREVGRSPGEGPAAGGPARPAEHEPVGEGPDEPGVVGWLVVQQVLQPGCQALQVLVACGQDARVD